MNSTVLTDTESSDVMVSVYIHTFNHSEYIAEAIESVLCQKVDFKYEICIGEDGSTDGAKDVCREYARRYPELIRLFDRDGSNKIFIHGMKTGRRNFLESLSACRGRYVAMLEGDDFWTDELKLQQQVDALEADLECSLCCHQTVVVDGNDATPVRDYKETMLEDRIFPTGECVGRSCFHLSSYCFRRSSLIERCYPQAFYTVLNMDELLFWYLSNRGKVIYLNASMSSYRVHVAGMYSSHRKDASGHFRRARWTLNTVLVAAGLFEEKGLERLLLSARSKLCKMFLRSLKRGALIEFLRTIPFFMRYIRLVLLKSII